MTAEEKAREYADGMYSNTDSNDYSRTTAEEWDACYDGYVTGYTEAMRWRDPKEEPPINQDIVLVKTDNDCYATAYFHGKASGFICYGDDAYIEFGDIIGWRPIE